MPFDHAGAERQQGYMYGALPHPTIGLPVALGCTARMEEKADGNASLSFAGDLDRPCR
ncbi:hypothetical protein [Azospirillum endophyticum]